MRSIPRGFTLVEMSIVLVIIGLIVAGITVSKEMLHAAKLQSVVREVNSLKTAIKAFKLQYRQLPGDLSNAEEYWGTYNMSWTPGVDPGGALNGDGDGTWDYLGICATADPSELEGLQAWRHLGKAGILPFVYQGDYMDGTGDSVYIPGRNMPASKIDPTAVYLVTGEWEKCWDHRMYQIHRSPYLQLGSYNNPSQPEWAQGGIAIARDALSIDTKMDDGNPGTGSMLAVSPPGEAGQCVDQEWDGTLPVAYVTSNTSSKCYLMFPYAL